jgi:nitrate reductase gamma subunit
VPDVLVTGFGTALRYAIMALGYGGLALSLIGALGLLYRRLSDPELKDFTAPADIFNLLFFLVAFGFALVHVLVVDPEFTRALSFVYGLFTFSMAALPGTMAEQLMTSVTVILLGMLVAYIPLTHMSHFIGKYFAYHAIRWSDEPNVPGSHLEKPIQDALGYRVSWDAPHIKGEGRKSWADVATEEQSK